VPALTETKFNVPDSVIATSAPAAAPTLDAKVTPPKLLPELVNVIAAPWVLKIALPNDLTVVPVAWVIVRAAPAELSTVNVPPVTATLPSTTLFKL